MGVGGGGACTGGRGGYGVGGAARLLLPTICYHHPSKLLHPQPSKATMPQTDSVAIISNCTNALTGLEERMQCTFGGGRKNARSPEPPLRLRPGLKNAAVLKNRCRRAEADQARGLLIVLQLLLEAAHGHAAWICCASRNGFVWSGKHISFQHLDY